MRTRLQLGAALLVSTAGLLACGNSDPEPSNGGGGSTQTGGSAGSGGARDGGTGGATGGASGGSSDASAETTTAEASDGDGAPDGASCAKGDLLCNPQDSFPAKLSATGFFPKAPDLATYPARLRAYKPSPELWSDGLHKQRFLLLPEGTKIDNTTRDNWSFPVGTILIKTFLDDGPNGDRAVETRLIRRTEAAFYEYAVYRWNADGTDADKINNLGETRTPVPVTITGEGSFDHDLPSQQDCKACHALNALKNAGKATAFIGFDEVRLNSKRDATSTQVQLEELSDVFMMPPPTDPVSITDADPKLEQVKRFVFGNCVHCHNNSNDPTDFSPDVFVANTVCKVTTSHVVTPPGWFIINGQVPDKSIAYVQAISVKPGTVLPDPSLRAMPPVGVTVPLTTELDNMKAWINSLAACPK